MTYYWPYGFVITNENDATQLKDFLANGPQRFRNLNVLFKHIRGRRGEMDVVVAFEKRMEFMRVLDAVKQMKLKFRAKAIKESINETKVEDSIRSQVQEKLKIVLLALKEKKIKEIPTRSIVKGIDDLIDLKIENSDDMTFLIDLLSEMSDIVKTADKETVELVGNNPSIEKLKDAKSQEEKTQDVESAATAQAEKELK